MIDIDRLTLGEIKQISRLVNNSKTNENSVFDDLIGKYVIIRTYSAGVHAGYLEKKSGNEVILRDSRRLFYWETNEGITLSALATNGASKNSKITEKLPWHWLEAIEIIPVNENQISTIRDAENVKAK